MNQPQRVGPWPKRLLDDAGLESPLSPELKNDLQAGLRECAADPMLSGQVARRAARRALAQLDARHSFGPHSVLSWGRSLLRPRVVLAAVGLALVLRLGGALAEELGPRAVVRLGDWVEREVASLGKTHHRRAPAPTTEARRDEAAEVTQPPGAAGRALELDEARTPVIALEVPPFGAPSPPIGGPMVVRQRSAVGTRRTHSPAPGTAPDALGNEATLVSQVVALAGKEPRGALDLLAGYWRDYPTGALRGEAAVAEVNALQSFGKHAEALARLDGWARDEFRGMSNAGDELSLTRLELMVSAGRCAEALPLLERQLSAQGSQRRWGRALLARAACKGKLGDSDGNRADLERYLRELPDGPRAPQVRHVLGIGD